MINYTYCRIGFEDTASGSVDPKELATTPILWDSFCKEHKDKCIRDYHLRKFGYEIFVISIN